MLLIHDPEQRIVGLQRSLEERERTTQHYQRRLEDLSPQTIDLCGGSVRWTADDFDCGIVQVGHIETDGGLDFYDEVLQYLRKGTFTREDGYEKNAGIVVLSDTLGNEGWADYPDENEFDGCSVFNMMETSLAQEWIRRGIISVSDWAYNPNSSHPIRTYTLRTEFGDESFDEFESNTGVNVEEYT